MLYIGGMQTKYLGIGLGLIVGVVLILAVTNSLSYAMSRLDGWGQALEYTTDDMWWTTYQTRNSLYAIGSGGLWGLGLGQSRMKYLYIPEPQNDFIFAVVVEELGLVGALMILLIFHFLCGEASHFHFVQRISLANFSVSVLPHRSAFRLC